MFSRSRIKAGVMGCATAAMAFLLAPVSPDSGAALVPATQNVTVLAKTSPVAARERDAMKVAVSTFVWGLSNGEAAAVWHFAPEEEKAEFGSKEAAYAFFVRAHAPLAYARQMTFDGIRFENGSPVARVYIKDERGEQWQASFLLARAGVGEWTIVDCWIDHAPGDLI
jgi:Domain of unknown function (DUF4864)